MKSAIAGMALAILALSPGAVPGQAAAQSMNSLSPSGDGDPMIYDFDYDTLAPLLERHGYAHEPGSIYGTEAIKVTADETVMVLMPTVCRGAGSNNGCVGLAMLGFFRDSVSNARNNSFNNRLFFSHAETTPDGNTVVERYLISDHGFSRQTFGVELKVFTQTVQAYGAFINAYRQTVAFDTDETQAGKIDNAVGPDENSPRTHLRRRAIEAFPGAYNDYGAFPDLMAE